MHRLIRILAAAAAFTGMAACSRTIAPEQASRTLSFTATVEAPESTKTVLQEDGSIFWSPSDSISVFRGSGGSGRFTSSNSVPAARAEFSGSMQGDPGSGDWWAVQPYSGTNSCDGESVTLTVPAVQSAMAGGFAPGMFPSVARSTGSSLDFMNLCGGVIFSLKESGITSVSFSSNCGEFVAGRVKVTMDAEGKPTASVLDGSTSVTLNAPEGFQAGKWYCISLLPGELSGGFTLSFTKGASTASREITKAVTVKRSVLGRLAQADEGVSFARKISILAIGNSFSVDAMHYLWNMLSNLGYKEIVLGNLYYGGCSLETHMSFISNASASYTYYTNTGGSWVTHNSYKAVDAMTSRKWDYVSMQQNSNNSGIASSYDPYLGQLVSIVRENCPGAKLMWHMTWAYQEGSTHSAFPSYGSDQMTMYNAITAAVNARILGGSDFSFVIPSGTAVQNLRTSYLGDNITRDGYHMSYNIGRMVTALMWARQISGEDISGISFTPSSYSYSSKLIAAMRDAVNSAYEQPFKVTESRYGKYDADYKPNTELQAVFTAAGYKLSDYTELPFSTTGEAYYNSSTKTNLGVTYACPSVLICKDNNSSASNLNQFCATGIFTKSEIPEGSVIVLRSGWQFRPEGWVRLTTPNGTASGSSGITRPANVTAGITEVTSAWWGKFNYRAFNIAKAGNPAMTEAERDQAGSAMAIFVPKN